MIKILDHIPLREVCWFKTGGVADYYVATQELDTVIEGLKEAKKLQVPARVIGEGTNILPSDSGFPGLIIKNQAKTIFFMHDVSQVIVDSGTPLQELVARSISAGYSGLEFLTNTGGTIGGALYRNRSLFGYQLSEYVKGATLYFPDTEAIRRVDREWFSFGHNTSQLKRLRLEDPDAPQPVILSITLQLSKMNHASCLQKVHYFHELQAYFPLPTGPSLQAFDCLSLDPALVTPGKPGPLSPTFYVPKNRFTQLKINAMKIAPANPNFILNTGTGVSNDAMQLIVTMKDIVQELYKSDAPLLIECIGPWET